MVQGCCSLNLQVTNTSQPLTPVPTPSYTRDPSHPSIVFQRHRTPSNGKLPSLWGGLFHRPGPEGPSPEPAPSGNLKAKCLCQSPVLLRKPRLQGIGPGEKSALGPVRVLGVVLFFDLACKLARVKY